MLWRMGRTCVSWGSKTWLHRTLVGNRSSGALIVIARHPGAARSGIREGSPHKPSRRKISRLSIAGREVALRTVSLSEVALRTVSWSEVALRTVSGSEVALRAITGREVALRAITGREVALRREVARRSRLEVALRWKVTLTMRRTWVVRGALVPRIIRLFRS